MICIPIRKRSLNALLRELKLAQKDADIVEIWFDELKTHSAGFEKIFKICKKPILYKATKLQNIEKILEFGPEFIDLDLSCPPGILKKTRKEHPEIQIIISYHNFTATPPDKQLQKIYDKIKNKGADLIKIAATAKTFEDGLRMLHFLEKNSKKQKLIALCMGKEGKITRAAGHLFGSYLMYAPITTKNKTAPGQLTFQELKTLQCLLK